jgi:hypothetical protein
LNFRYAQALAGDHPACAKTDPAETLRYETASTEIRLPAKRNSLRRHEPADTYQVDIG